MTNDSYNRCARGTARRSSRLFSHEEAPRGPIFAERRQGCASWFIESNFSRPLEVWRVRVVPRMTDCYLVTCLAGTVFSACCTAGWFVGTLITKSCRRILIVFLLERLKRGLTAVDQYFYISVKKYNCTLLSDEVNGLKVSIIIILSMTYGKS